MVQFSIRANGARKLNLLKKVVLDDLLENKICKIYQKNYFNDLWIMQDFDSFDKLYVTFGTNFGYHKPVSL